MTVLDRMIFKNFFKLVLYSINLLMHKAWGGVVSDKDVADLNEKVKDFYDDLNSWG